MGYYNYSGYTSGLAYWSQRCDRCGCQRIEHGQRRRSGKHAGKARCKTCGPKCTNFVEKKKP